MLHILFEFSPFISGLLLGLLIFMLNEDRRLRPKLIVGGSLVIGMVCSLIAGELAGGLPTALSCIAIDSGTAALGWLVGHFALKRITA